MTYVCTLPLSPIYLHNYCNAHPYTYTHLRQHTPLLWTHIRIRIPLHISYTTYAYTYVTPIY